MLIIARHVTVAADRRGEYIGSDRARSPFPHRIVGVGDCDVEAARRPA